MYPRLPDLIFLLIDDFTTTAQRAQERSAEAYQEAIIATMKALILATYAEREQLP